MKIEVTQDDIDKGIPGDCERCPVARAVKRAGLKDISVTIYYIQIRKGKEYNDKGEMRNDHYIKFDPSITQQIIDFDLKRNTVAPFHFELPYNP